MKIILAPDSFKGNISASEFCAAAKKGIMRILPDTEVVSVPLADGGEGTLACVLEAGEGRVCSCEISGAYFEKKIAPVGFFGNGDALVESALAMGLPSVKSRENPEKTSTYGVGEMIKFAIGRGASHIIIALGGSSTNDCGAGMLSALGVKFFDCSGKQFIPVGGALKDVARIDRGELSKLLCGVKITAMCDVNNPLCGENGASHIYGPQKGADEAMVLRLDEGCAHFAKICAEYLGKDYSEMPGAGAAGGLGFACVAFLGGELRSGIDTMLDLCGYDSKLDGCDLIITGEGSFDAQSLMGKTIGGLVKRSGDVPVAVFCGRSTLAEGEVPEGILAVREISKGQELEYALTHGAENVERSAEEFFKEFVAAGGKN